ncbi:MAG: PAS domain-containing protein [Nitrosomonas sp.]|nr:PAS domain-containing protein [Nitrosomonas sp.]
MIDNNDNHPTLVVGIGASAGGLDALKRFFKSIPENSRLAFIVVQHLDPTHKSIMAEILNRETSLSVCEAKNKQNIEANCTYIIPPNTYIEVNDHTIKISKPKQKRGFRMSIDYLFRSMADSYKSQGVGVLFSGAGSDGTAGLRALKAAGGLTIVQDPKTATHASMPRSAIDAGVVDRVLKIEKIAPTLIDYAKHPYAEYDEEETRDEAENDLRMIGALLKTRENFDLYQYKESTVYRRVCRRMSLTGTTDRSAYIDLLRNNNDERRYLMQDLLINVTDFFRDPKAYDALEEKALDEIIDGAEHDADIRIWVAGCASGEEAYSLSMLIMEKIEKSCKDLDLKVFATDVDEEAIKTARRGMYPASIISELPNNYLEKYFTPIDENNYKVLTHLREKISFATHNVYADPPFSKIDLISCRNLLIYLRRSVQHRVLKSFHFALNTEGYLFLGSSESIGEHKSLFKQISQKWRIYKRLDNVKLPQPALTTPSFFTKRPRTLKGLEKRRKINLPGPADHTRAALLKCVGPSVLIDGNNQILYLHGNLNDYIKIPEGEPKLDFIQMLDPSLRTRLRSGIYKVRRSKGKVVIPSPKSFTEENPDKKGFQAIVCPANHKNLDEDSLIITFEKIAIDEDAITANKSIIGLADQDKMVEAMERELLETREELQNTVEELETSTEELKASHEEALSTNEELQSANEELEANAEELRSLNEELTTVNSQLKEKIDELQNAHDDLSNFFASTNLATLFLGNELKIKRYTPAAERLLRMGPQDLERPIKEISRMLIDDDTFHDAKNVLESLESSEKEMENEDGRWFIRKILPYRTEDKRIAGVVVTFNDITELKQATKNVEIRERQHAVVAKLGFEALSSDNIQELMDHAVREVAYTLDSHYCKVLEYHPDQNELLLKAGIGWKEGIVGKAYVSADKGSQAGYTLIEYGPVIVDDLRSEKRFSGPDLLTSHKVISGMSCIIETGEHPYGVLGIHSRDKKNFTKDDANFLISVANILSIALNRKQAQKKLLENAQRLRIAKDSAKLGAFEYSLETGEIEWDDLLTEIWGLDPGEEPTIDLFYKGLHTDDQEKTRASVEAATSSKGTGHYHAIYRVINKKTKKQRWIEASGQMVFKDEQPIKMFGMVIDITAQKELENSLNDAILKLETANTKKNEFLATLGHELRNPLAAINSCVQIMQLDIKESKWALDMMSNNVKLIASLLDDLLDLTRIERGKIRLKKEIISLNDIFVEILEGFLPKSLTKQQKLDSDITDEPIYINGDRTRLEQIFSNVLTNAHKFTPVKGLIRAVLEKTEDKAIIKIQDNGVGIQKDKIEKIFNPFEQFNNSKISEEGLGIGLSLVHQFVKLHGGKTDVESEGVNKGSIFTITLPLADSAARPKKVAKKERMLIKENLRVMIIDDNKDAVWGLKSILEKEKCHVSTAYTGKMALEKVNEFNPEALIVDIGLPNMDGYELIDKIKSQYKGESLYIAVTGYGHQEAQKKSKKAGFDHHLNKPANLSELLKILSTIKPL